MTDATPQDAVLPVPRRARRAASRAPARPRRPSLRTLERRVEDIRRALTEGRPAAELPGLLADFRLAKDALARRREELGNPASDIEPTP